MAGRFLENLIAFGRVLREAGLSVGTDRLTTLVESLPLVDLSASEDVRAVCRTVLVQRHEDILTFDRIFDRFWSSTILDQLPTDDRPEGKRAEATVQTGLAEASELDARSAADAERIALRTWSNIDTIATKDFAVLSPDETALARAAMDAIDWNAGDRRTRRWVRGNGTRVDIRRAVAASLRTGAEIIDLPARRRRRRPRPIVLLCDVSGSMELYSRTLLHFAHTLAVKTRSVEAFLFATRLTRITMELRSPKPDAAITAVSSAVRDWSGGTRIGEALRGFHLRWRRRVLRSDAIVVVISDGWDCGDPSVLRDEMARLQRSCHRVVWLNPLIGSFDYAPLTRGLQAALPFVDDFLPVRTLRDVRDLAVHLASIRHHGDQRLVQLRRTSRARLGADAGSGPDRVLHPRV